MTRHTLLKLAALFSYCGGPLFISNDLKQRFEGSLTGFWLTFPPVGFMIIGALCLGDSPTSRWARAMVWAGKVGLFLALGMHAYAVWCFAHGEHPFNQSLHTFGIIVGVVWSIVYLLEARRWEALPGGPTHAVDPASTDPIEPS